MFPKCKRLAILAAILAAGSLLVLVLRVPASPKVKESAPKTMYAMKSEHDWN